MRNGVRALFLACVVLLAGCAQLPLATAPAAPAAGTLDAFVLEGRFSLRQDERNASGRLSWKHTRTGDELLLASPFGQGVAEIVVTPAAATLTTGDGKTYEAPDAESLTERVLGYRLPLQRLVDWVRGRESDAEVVERDAQGRPLRLRHEAWSVEYGYDGDDPAAAPARLFAQLSGSFELRLRIDEWTPLAGEARP